MSESNVSPVPEGQRLFPYLIVAGAADAIAFYTRAFGAKERYRLEMGERIGHAEITFEGVTVFLADAFPEMGHVAPGEGRPTPVSLSVYVTDVDGVVARAVAAGAKLLRPANDEFYGDRVAQVEDPFGHRWSFHSRREIVAPDEMKRRMRAQG